MTAGGQSHVGTHLVPGTVVTVPGSNLDPQEHPGSPRTQVEDPLPSVRAPNPSVGTLSTDLVLLPLLTPLRSGPKSPHVPVSCET